MDCSLVYLYHRKKAAVQLDVGRLSWFRRMRRSLPMRLLQRSVVGQLGSWCASLSRAAAQRQCGAEREARRFARGCRAARSYTDSWLCSYILQVGGEASEERWDCGGGGGVERWDCGCGGVGLVEEKWSGPTHGPMGRKNDIERARA
jgi:hypothetical protein